MAGKKRSSRPEPKATAADAEIVMRLFEFRRDETMRKARNYVTFEFSPRTNEELLSVLGAFGTPEQTYWRMVSSYWEQAASLVNRGAVHAGLFDDWANELYFLYAKYKEFLPAVRANMNPTAWQNIEKLANRSAETRERVARMEKMIAERMRPRAAK